MSLNQEHQCFTVQDVITAQCTLQPLKCVHCGNSEEVTFNQYIGDAYCENCGNWQVPDKQEMQP